MDELAGAAVTDRSVGSTVAFVVSGRVGALGRIAATAFAGGVTEALFLVSVTRTAFAITDGDDRVGIISGWFLPVRGALLLALALVIMRIALAALASWQSALLSSKVVADLRNRVGAAYLESAWPVQQAQATGSLQELLSGYTAQAASLMTNVSQAVLALSNLFALLLIAVAVDPLGALVLVVSVAILGTLLRPLRRIVKRRSRSAAEAGMRLATGVAELSQLGMELHVFSVQASAQARLAEAIAEVREKGRRLQFAAGLSAPLYSGLAYLALLGALAVVSMSDATSLTSLGAAMLVMLRSLSYGQALQSASTNVTATIPAIDELRRRLAVFDVARRVGGRSSVGHVGALLADGVSFAYDDGREVLKDLSFRIEPREIIGIVGPSGSGKSTLVQLLLGLRDPTRGRILAGGRDIGEFDKSEWARKVTFVPQAPRLISGTIEENVRFLRDGISRDDVERACRLAHVHDDITTFPEGYWRQVGELGGHLSGGQQQRLCIARALVEDPEVLILDEPTSSLDVRSEHLVRATLLELKKRMTVVIIAHRLSTLDICDRIMVIQDGHLRGFDTPAQLETSNAFYREALVLSGMR